MTANLNGMTLPSWASHVEDKLAPMPLLLVQAFVDTLDRDLGTDKLADSDEARAWLADAGLRVADPDRPEPNSPGFADDLRLAREARAGIQALIGRNTGHEPLTPDDLAPLEQVLGQAQPRLEVGADGRVRLGPDLPARTLTDGLLGLLLIIRDAQADAVCLMQHSDGRHVVRAHHRRGQLGAGQQFLGRGHAPLHGVVAFNDPALIGHDATLLYRALKRRQARLRRMQLERPGYKRDIPVAQSGQMLHALADSVMIVHAEQADARPLGPHIHKHQGNVAFSELVQQRLLDAEGHHGHAFGLAFDHAANAALHPLGIVVG